MGIWKEGKIKDFADVKGGKRLPKGKQLISSPTAHPYIRIRDIGKSKIIQLTSDFEYVDNETQKDISKYIVAKGDILISVVGTIGLVGIVGDTLDGANQTENCDKLTNFKGIDRDFLYYYLISPLGQGEIKKGTVGAVQPKLPLKNIQDLSIRFPSLQTQRKISSIISAIDDKIMINERINENLDQQAKAFFTAFISDHKTTTVTVEDIVLTANTGADAIQKAPIVDHDTGVRCVRVGDMSNHRPVQEWGFAQVTPEVFKQYQLHKDDIVITRTASLGLNRLIGEDLSAVYNNGLIRISINQDVVYPLIVYRQFQTDDYRNYISRISGETSVRPNMKINYLLKYSFDIPCLSDQAELISVLQPIFETQEKNIFENQTLSSLRDTLLSKLISGELDVSDIDI